MVLCQRYAFTRGIQAKIKRINEKLEEILEAGSDEKVMIFTDNPVLRDLSGHINRLLIERQKMKANFKREQISSKKMLTNISHDIKTPLTVILGYLEILRLDCADDEMLGKVEEKAKQVVSLINQFFTLAKLESGDTEINVRKININEVCKEAVLGYYDILLRKGFEVDLSIPNAPVWGLGDKEALQRILYNLFSNVVCYGSDGKYLGIFIHEDKSSSYIDVVDKGKGIEPEFVSNVFNRLYTMEDSKNQEIQGNGLGLAIAKNLAEKMGGDIYLESVPNTKTTFTVKLKKANC